MDRETLIRAILECNFAGYDSGIIDIAVKRIMEVTGEVIVKSKDAEPVRHGHWIETHEVLDYIKCSECGKEWCTVANDTETFNYCPNCGAKMDEVRDE